MSAKTIQMKTTVVDGGGVKTQVNGYPITTPDRVIDENGVTVEDLLSQKVGEAPEDSKQYARKNGNWVEVDATADFEQLNNRPKYNGTTMDKNTNIPEVKTSTWDGKQNAITSSNKLSADLLSAGTTNKLVSQSEKDTWSAKQSAITSSSKLSADLVSDGTTNKVVTQTEKDTWSAKQSAITSSAKLSADLVADGTTNKVVTQTEKDTWGGKSVVSVSNTGTATDTVKYITVDGVEKKLAGGAGGGAWGEITGNLEDQTDLNTRLTGIDNKVDPMYDALMTCTTYTSSPCPSSSNSLDNSFWFLDYMQAETAGKVVSIKPLDAQSTYKFDAGDKLKVITYTIVDAATRKINVKKYSDVITIPAETYDLEIDLSSYNLTVDAGDYIAFAFNTAGSSTYRPFRYTSTVSSSNCFGCLSFGNITTTGEVILNSTEYINLGLNAAFGIKVTNDTKIQKLNKWGGIEGHVENQTDLNTKLTDITVNTANFDYLFNDKVIYDSVSSTPCDYITTDYLTGGKWLISDSLRPSKSFNLAKLESIYNYSDNWTTAGTVDAAIVKLDATNRTFTVVSPVFQLPVGARNATTIVTDNIYLKSDECLAIKIPGEDGRKLHYNNWGDPTSKSRYYFASALPEIGKVTAGETNKQDYIINLKFNFKSSNDTNIKDIVNIREYTQTMKQITDSVDLSQAIDSTRTTNALDSYATGVTQDNNYYLNTSRLATQASYVTKMALDSRHYTDFTEDMPVTLGVFEIVNDNRPTNVTIKAVAYYDLVIPAGTTEYTFEKPIFLDKNQVISMRNTVWTGHNKSVVGYGGGDSVICVARHTDIGTNATYTPYGNSFSMTPQFTYSYKSLPDVLNLTTRVASLEANKLDTTRFEPIEEMFKQDTEYTTGFLTFTGVKGGGGCNYATNTAIVPHDGILTYIKNCCYNASYGANQTAQVDAYDYNIETGEYTRVGTSTVKITSQEWIQLDTPFQVYAGNYIIWRSKLDYIHYDAKSSGAKGTWIFPNNDSGTFEYSEFNHATTISIGYKIIHTTYKDPFEGIDGKLDVADFEEFYTDDYSRIKSQVIIDHNTTCVDDQYQGAWSNNDNNKIKWATTTWKATHNGYLDRIIIPNATSETVTLSRNITVGIITVDIENQTWTRRGECQTVTVNPGDTYIELSPMEIQTGDYIGLWGTFSYFNQKSGHKSSIGTMDFVANASGTFTTTPFTRNEVPNGVNFRISWQTIRDLDAEFAERDEAIQEAMENATFMTDETIFDTAEYASTSMASPGSIYWLSTNYSIPQDGQIVSVDIKHTQTAKDETFAIGRFSVDATAHTITLLGRSTGTLHAGERIGILDTPLQVYTGDYIGLLCSKHPYTATTSNQGGYNGCNINSPIGTVGTGYYGGAYTEVVSYVLHTEVPCVDKMLEDEAKIADLEERTADLKTSTSYKDMKKIALIGSSLTEASYTPNSTTWPERLNDAVDINVINWGWSGHNIKNNNDMLIANGNTRFYSTAFSNVKPQYLFWDDCANGSATGDTAIQQYRHSKEIAQSLGAKLIMGSEENYANNYSGYERTQQAFAEQEDLLYSPITRIQEWCYPRSGGYCPYPVNGSSHAGYRAIAPYLVHKDLIEKLPIYKSVKLYKVRKTYKAGDPAIADLAYDTVDQRLRYWTAICPGQCGGCAPGHIDNLDGSANDVPGTTNTGVTTSETTGLYLGNAVSSFNKYALVEFILERINITKGTFSIVCSVEPSNVYIAKSTNTTQTYTDDFIRTSFDEITDYTYNSVSKLLTFSFTNAQQAYELYDKVRIVIKTTGAFSLSKPCLENYDGVEKVFDDTIHYQRRKFGTELNSTTSMETGWTTSGTAAVKSLPSPIANYTKYNEIKSHMQLNADNDSCSKTISFSGSKYRKVAVRIVSQMWQNIATIRYNGTEWEDNEYIDNDTSATGAAAYVNTDYDYSKLKVTINSLNNRYITVYPGWHEAYFEVFLTPEDTSLTIKLTKSAFVDDSYTNDDKPIFIHNVSVQELTD